MGVVFQCTDQFGREVELTDDTWYNHIVPKHRIMDGYERCVQKALTDPYRVRDDRAEPDRINFYRPQTHPKRLKSFVKVVVQYYPPDRSGRISGKVVTAFLTDHFVEGEEQLWP